MRQRSLEDNRAEEAQYEAEDAQNALAKSRIETKKMLSDTRIALRKAKSQYPFRPELVIDLQKQAEAYEKGLQRLDELEKELF